MKGDDTDVLVHEAMLAGRTTPMVELLTVNGNRAAYGEGLLPGDIISNVSGSKEKFEIVDPTKSPVFWKIFKASPGGGVWVVPIWDAARWEHEEKTKKYPTP